MQLSSDLARLLWDMMEERMMHPASAPQFSFFLLLLDIFLSTKPEYCSFLSENKQLILNVVEHKSDTENIRTAILSVLVAISHCSSGAQFLEEVIFYRNSGLLDNFASFPKHHVLYMKLLLGIANNGSRTLKMAFHSPIIAILKSVFLLISAN